MLVPEESAGWRGQQGALWRRQDQELEPAKQRVCEKKVPEEILGNSNMLGTLSTSYQVSDSQSSAPPVDSGGAPGNQAST